jgi:hypothetical protein
MSISHVKSNTIADFTGTVTVFNSVGATETRNATDLVRPSDWNSAHNQFYTLTGNTNNASTASGTNVVLSGGNGVTLIGSNSVIGFSVATNYQSQGAYLTTARASNDAIGLNTAQTNVTWTVNSSGLSLNAAGYAGTATAITGNAAITLNSAGLSFNGSSLAGVSSGFTGDGISGSMTHNSAGLALSLAHPAWLTTAALSNHSHGNPTLALTNLSGTTASASNGLTLSLSAAAPVTTNGLISAINVSAGTTSNNLSAVTFANSNGITFGLNASTVTASHNGLTQQSTQPVAVSGQNGSYAFSTLSFSNANGISFGTSAGSALTASHNGLTTARASNDAIGLNTALTAGPLAWTVNSSGLSLNAASAAGTTTGFAGANISGSMTHNTAGLNLSLSVAAPGAAAENNAINLLGANTAGNTTATGSTIGWSGVNLTLSGTNASQVVISAPPVSSLSATGAVSISTNGSTISIGAPAEVTLAGYVEPALDREWLAAQIGNNQLFIQPMNIRQPVVCDRIVIPVNFSNATNSSNSATLTMQAAIFTRNGNTLSLLDSGSGSFAVTASGTVGSYSLYGGIRNLTFGLSETLSAGNYWFGILSRTTTGGGAGMTWSNIVASNINSALSGFWGSANNATNQYALGLGSFNTTTTAIPNSVAFAAINGSAAVNLRQAVFHLASSTV